MRKSIASICAFFLCTSALPANAQAVGGTGGTAGSPRPGPPPPSRPVNTETAPTAPSIPDTPKSPPVGAIGGTAGRIRDYGAASGSSARPTKVDSDVKMRSVGKKEFLLDMEKLFDKYDRDGSGRIDKDQRDRLLKEMLRRP